MNRYQVYLDPQSVQSTDELARSLDISRSQIIRDVVSRVILEYKKILSIRNYVSPDQNPILKMIGMGQTSKKHVSKNVDEIYLRD
ncbi:CopG family transcriptional regulator [Candidatus Gottesmanbacteria bacterium]|nr:CopG family transcriptional regulator [Candidatus Gottesmanbacteria bacterium]